MKSIRLFSTIILTLIGLVAIAQTSQRGFSFQGYAANIDGVALTQEQIDVKFTIYPKSGIGYVYEEEQRTGTDAYGVFHLVVGIKTPTLFQRMNFTAKGADYWLRVEVKKASEFNYVRISDAQMLAVPYARFADNGVPVGTIISFAGEMTKVPAGWLLCDGQQYDGTDVKYEQLYKVLENTWGGAGASFNVPELRGYFLRGFDNGQGNDPDAAARTALMAGGNTGDMVGSYQTDDYQSHKHDINDPKHSHPYSDRYNKSEDSDNADDRVVGSNSTTTRPMTTDKEYTGITIKTSGGTETRPKNAYVLYIIKY